MSSILFQTGLVYYLLEKDTDTVLSSLTRELIPLKLKIFSTIPQLSAILFFIVFAVVVLRYISTKSYLDAANIGVLAVIFTALCKKSDPMSIPVFFTASGLILIISVIQESYGMAFMDELTALPSRRSLRYELMKLSGRYTIAMLDIDHFKKFNDTYGHDVGDQVLKMVAGCIRDITGGGKPFRYGGEEFTVLFPNKSLKDAIPHLEMLREAVSKKGFIQRSANRPKNKPKSSTGKNGTGKQLFVTISIGVAEKNDKYRLPDEVIKGADTALYRAKKKGRNCVSK
jgi:diguanylate cyclase (GGDEF)-like protein